MPAALSGVRIIELGHALSVPFAMQLLADFGAEVIKIERPGVGDLFRPAASPFARDKDGNILESSGFLATNRNKKSVAVDISKPEGQEIVRQLAARADVVVENLKTGDLARHGLDYPSLKSINPRLIYLSLTGFGQTGPYAARGGLDGIFQAMSGVMSVTGEPDGPPQRVGYLLADTTSGMYAAMGVLIALYHRDAAGGTGQYIDLAMLDAMIAAMSSRVQGYLVSGEIPQRSGVSRGGGSAPAQPLPCKDGDLSVSASLQSQFPGFCESIGHPEFMRDPRFNTYHARIENRELLIDELSVIFREKTVGEWHELMVARGVVCAPVYTIPQVLEDPQVRTRGVISSMSHPTVGTLPIIRNPINMQATPAQYTLAPPLVGEHTDSVLAEFLGMSAGDISALHAKGVVGSAPGGESA
jgi:crotonobetainyl-CoA:carnitine CoA-transferase CaiB-like acyl-CoA transferase